MKYGIVIQPIAAIYEVPEETVLKNGVTLSAIADEVLYGMGIAIIGEKENGFLPVRTFYGYTGFIRTGDIKIVSIEELQCWENERLMVTTAFWLDVMSVPMVQGVRLESLARGSLLTAAPFGKGAAGWAKVRLADGRYGYVREQYLDNKEFSQAGLWTAAISQKKIVDEKAFRRAVVETAKTYLGVQYRWGGRSAAGIDCSGLTSECYLLNGILIWRDARIVRGYPVHEIAGEKMGPGDLLYFPGHIAMYIGDGRYIHSTGKAGSGGVVINSLNPNDADYRGDLAECLYAVGSIF